MPVCMFLSLSPFLSTSKIQFYKEENNRWRKGKICSVLELKHTIFPTLAYHTLGSQAFGLRLNTASFPGSPACRQHMGLLGLHQGISQFL